MTVRTSKRVNLKDIAEKAEISIAAVSMALADHPRIGLETKRRVRQLSRQLGYEKSSRTRPASLLKTETVGYMLVGERLENEVEAFTLHALMEAAEDAGVRLLAGAVEQTADTTTIIQRVLNNAPEDGLLLCGWINSALIAALSKAHVPHVIIGSTIADDLTPGGVPGHSVSSDFEEMGRFATSWLIQWGHRRIGFAVETMPHGMFSDLWRRGYYTTLIDHGIELDPRLIYNAGKQVVSAEDAIEHFLSLKDPPTAYVIPDVRLAALIQHAMTARGKPLDRRSMVMASFPALASRFGLSDFPFISYDVRQVAAVALRQLRHLRRDPLPYPMRTFVPFASHNIAP